MTSQESRKFFPYLKTDLKYFNHAAIGPLSSRTVKAINDYISQRSETIVENFFETLPQFQNAKRRIAAMLNVGKENIAWTDNVSNGLNVIAQGLIWKSGDQIILNNIEFPSNVYPFLNLEKDGVEIIFAKSEAGKVDLEQLEPLVTPKTRLISISMVQFLTGYRADLQAIGDFCKKKNIIFCVDGIQGAGVVRVDPKLCHIDFFAGGTQKWLMGLQGTSYFYISPRLHEMINPKYVGWTSVKDAWNFTDYNLNFLDSADRYQNGTMSRIGVIAADASLSLFEDVGYDNIENQILDNTEYLIGHMNELNLKPILQGVKRKNLAGIISFKHEEAQRITDKLKEKKIMCSLREGIVRFSPHFYNDKADLDYLINVLRGIVLK